MPKFFSCVLLALLLSGCTEKIKLNTACFENGECIALELTDSGEEREQGLMFRQSLGENSGMLFVFEGEERHGFWMKNTLIPLDIIWVGSDSRIVDVFENAQPCKTSDCPIMSPQEKARWVIEANSGFAKKNNIMIGQAVVFDYS